MSKPRRQASTPRVTQPAAQPKPNWDLAIYLGLVLCVLATYSQVGHFDFVTFDDQAYIVADPHVSTGLSFANIKYAFTAVVGANWVPITILSHMAVCSLYGLESGVHHWVNVLLHALSAVLLFASLRRATRALWPSAFVAFVFALHPLHVESVAWVSERKDTLSTVFWFAALYAYVRYAERPDLRRYAFMTALFCLGLLSKPMLVTFPFTLLLLDVWPLRRAQWPRTLWEKVPLILLTIPSAAVTYFVQHAAPPTQPPVTLATSFINALISYVAYIGQMFWPTGLAIFYPYRESLSAWQGVCAAVVILALSALAIFFWRTRPYLATGWFWYLGTLVPVIGLVQVGDQSHADRYMYVPMVGLSIVLAWGAADVIRKWPWARPAFATVAVAACLACLLVARTQTEYWRDSETLYDRAIDVTNKNFLAQYNLACYLMKIPGRAAEGVTHLQNALRIAPEAADAQSALAQYLLETGHDAEAIVHYQAALRSAPDSAVLHFNLGVAYSKNPAHILDAISQYQAALHSDPSLADAHKNLGLLLLSTGKKADAIAQFEAALRLQPDPDLARMLDDLRAR